MKQIKAIIQLWRILHIEDIGVGDKPTNPFTGQVMSFTDRCSLKQKLWNEWLVENGYSKLL